MTRIREYVPASLSLSPDSLVASINYARRELNRIFDFNISTSKINPDGVNREYDLPQNVQKILSVKCIYGLVRYPLKKIPIGEYDLESYISLPVHYWINIGANKIGFYPIPQTGCQLELKCSLMISDLSNYNDPDIIPAVFQDMVVYLAISDSAMKTGNASLGTMYLNLYNIKRTQVPTREL
jgi:hypothetical protein